MHSHAGHIHDIYNTLISSFSIPRQTVRQTELISLHIHHQSALTKHHGKKALFFLPKLNRFFFSSFFSFSGSSVAGPTAGGEG